MEPRGARGGHVEGIVRAVRAHLVGQGRRHGGAGVRVPREPLAKRGRVLVPLEHVHEAPARVEVSHLLRGRALVVVHGPERGDVRDHVVVQRRRAALLHADEEHRGHQTVVLGAHRSERAPRGFGYTGAQLADRLARRAGVPRGHDGHADDRDERRGAQRGYRECRHPQHGRPLGLHAPLPEQRGALLHRPLPHLRARPRV